MRLAPVGSEEKCADKSVQIRRQIRVFVVHIDLKQTFLLTMLILVRLRETISSIVQSRVTTKLYSVFPTRSDTNRAVKPQKMARGLKFLI